PPTPSPPPRRPNPHSHHPAGAALIRRTHAGALPAPHASGSRGQHRRSTETRRTHGRQEAVMVDPEMTPALRKALNTEEPHSARGGNYVLGGRDNFAADRAAAASILEFHPWVAQVAAESRKTLIRVLRFLSEVGVAQFLDIGTGLPTAENTVHARALL